MRGNGGDAWEWRRWDVEDAWKDAWEWRRWDVEDDFGRKRPCPWGSPSPLGGGGGLLIRRFTKTTGIKKETKLNEDSAICSGWTDQFRVE